jgi:hypothetical protein
MQFLQKCMLIEGAGSLTGVPTTLDYHKLILEIQV